jgi:hypothetical protein
MEQRVRYDAHGRRARRWTTRRIVLVAVIVLVLLIVSYVVFYVIFNMGGTVPGSGEGDQISL